MPKLLYSESGLPDPKHKRLQQLQIRAQCGCRVQCLGYRARWPFARLNLGYMTGPGDALED